MSDLLTTWLQTVRERLAKATPGPWAIVHEVPDEISGIYAGKERIIETDSGFYPPRLADADLIAHSPTDLTRALDLLEAAQAVVKAARPFSHPGDGPGGRLADALTHYQQVVEAGERKG